MKVSNYFLVLIFFMMACVPQTSVYDSRLPPDYYDSEPPPEYYDDKKDSDEDREYIISTADKKYKGRECIDSEKCRELCDEMYSRSDDVEDCEKRSEELVRRLKDVYDVLEDPDDYALRRVDLDDFDTFINISIRPLHNLVRAYSNREAEEVLIWIIADPDVTRIWEKEDDNYKGLVELLKNIRRDIEDALTTNIADGMNVMDLVVSERNDRAGEWIHELIEAKECRNNVETIGCLSLYCRIAEQMETKLAEDLINFNYFENYLEGIIDERVGYRIANTSTVSMWSRQFNNVNDLNDEWWKDLCR